MKVDIHVKCDYKAGVGCNFKYQSLRSQRKAHSLYAEVLKPAVSSTDQEIF